MFFAFLSPVRGLSGRFCSAADCELCYHRYCTKSNGSASVQRRYFTSDLLSDIMAAHWNGPPNWPGWGTYSSFSCSAFV